MNKLALLLLLVAAACTLGPDYERPTMALPDSINGQAGQVALSKSWWQAFGDPVLNTMIEEALLANDDLAVAAARVAEARASLDLAEANRLPLITGTGTAIRNKTSRNSFGTGTVQTNGAANGGVGTGGTTGSGGGGATATSFLSGIRNSYSVSALLSFDLDLWGRLRRADEAAQAALLSTEAARDTVRLTVLTDVASAYFNLLAIDAQIAVTENTLKSREEGLALFEKRFKAEVISALDVRQAESELAVAREQLPILLQQRTRQENALSILLGKSPQEIVNMVPRRGNALPDMPLPPTIPQILPSQLLERRPDIITAEQQLRAVNAEIGIARANYFPQLSLTGLFGWSSLDIDRLFRKSSEQWRIGGDLTGPILDFGRTSADVDTAEARTAQALGNYQKTVRTAFADVVNAYAEQSNSEARLKAGKQRVESLSEYLRLGQLRYDAGYSDYLDVLDAQRSLFSAQLDLYGSERDRLIAVLNLYKALGGGWK